MKLPRSLLPAIAILVLAAGAPAGTAAASVVKYYASGKQIPAPVNLPPVYPASEQRRRIGGTVIVAYAYGADGKVVSASVKTSSGNQNLDKAAVTAVRKWVVSPRVEDGKPVAGEAETPVTFTP